jgi:hypothetical protein
MTKEEVYRRYALFSLQLAEGAPTMDQRGRLLRIAQIWLDLADGQLQAPLDPRESKSAVLPHVREKFGSHAGE